MVYLDPQDPCMHDPFAVSFTKKKIFWRLYKCSAVCRYCHEVVDSWYEWRKPDNNRRSYD